MMIMKIRGRTALTNLEKIIHSTLKTCKHCGIIKTLDHFYSCHLTKDRLQTWCKGCKRKHNREHPPKTYKGRKRNPLERIKAYKKYKAEKYGITAEQFDAQLEKQKYVCAICGGTAGKTLCIDHCHKTQHVRGLLCDSCNKGLGCFKDNENNLSRAIGYLRNPVF